MSTGDLFGDMPPRTASSATADTGTREAVGATAPLAERLRPADLTDVRGQEHLTASDGPIGRMIAKGQASSMILHGPPGTGKTTIARLVSTTLGLKQVQLSAIGTGVADLKKVFAEAQDHARATGSPTVLFVDEIHRFNKAQQDAFLPHMEAGTIILIGATTENPSFELNAALLSRAQTYMLEPLGPKSLEEVLDRAERENGRLPVTAEARATLISNAAGDARYLLGQVERLLGHDGPDLDTDGMERLLSRRLARHDKSGDGHYDLASAFQKSVRGSDPQAALYYAARMIDGGETPVFIFRRLIVMASEEVGMADPTALSTVIAAREAFDMVGLPEAGYALAQAIIHVATAPKSNAAYLSWGHAMELARDTRGISPPRRILNAPTRLMKEQGRKAGYQYDHDHPGAFSGQDFWPDELGPQRLYEPNPRGFEDKIRQRMEHWDAIRREGRQER
jgi:putative ATPase